MWRENNSNKYTTQETTIASKTLQEFMTIALWWSWSKTTFQVGICYIESIQASKYRTYGKLTAIAKLSIKPTCTNFRERYQNFQDIYPA